VLSSLSGFIVNFPLPGEGDGDVLALEGVHLCAGVVVDLAPVVLAQYHQRVVGPRLQQEDKIKYGVSNDDIPRRFLPSIQSIAHVAHMDN
jgi:hypothetical protein